MWTGVAGPSVAMVHVLRPESAESCSISCRQRPHLSSLNYGRRVAILPIFEHNEKWLGFDPNLRGLVSSLDKKLDARVFLESANSTCVFILAFDKRIEAVFSSGIFS